MQKMQTRTANTHIIDQINYDESKPIREHTLELHFKSRVQSHYWEKLKKKNLNYGIRLAGHAVKSVL